jgi:O-antigen/teichoic acid export membrane protein
MLYIRALLRIGKRRHPLSFRPQSRQHNPGDARTVLPLKVLAVSLPFISVSSSLSGYFTAVRRVYKNAAVQVAGQFARIFLCIYLLSFFMARDTRVPALP